MKNCAKVCIIHLCAEKKVNIAGLRLLSLEKPTCKAGSSLVSRNLCFITVPNKISFMCLDHLYTV